MGKCSIALHLIEYKMQYGTCKRCTVINMVICGVTFEFSVTVAIKMQCQWIEV